MRIAFTKEKPRRDAGALFLLFACFCLRLEEHGVDDYQEDADDIGADVEDFVGLEHVAGQGDGFGVVVGLAVAEADHEDDDNGDDAGVEHLVHEGHFKRQELEEQGYRDGGEHAPDGAFVGCLFPEQAHEEDGEDARADESGVFLDVLEHLVDAAQHRGEQDGDNQGNACAETPDVHELPLGSLGLDVGLVDIHGEDGGRGVEHGCQRGDDGGCQGGEHQAFQADGDERADEPRVGVVVVKRRGAGNLEGCAGIVHVLGIHNPSHDAGHGNDERNQHFQEGGKGDAPLRFLQGAGCQGALDDVLVETPVVEVGNPKPADEHVDAGQVVVFLVVAGEYHVEFVACHVCHVGDAVDDTAFGGDVVEGDDGGDDAADDEEGNLEHVRPCDSRQASVEGVGGGEERQRDDGGHDHGAVAGADYGVDGFTAEVEHGGQVDEDEEGNPKYRQDGLEVGGKAPFDKFGDGVDALFDEDGQEEFAHDNQGKGCHKFVGGDCQSAGKTGTGHADELFRRDVGSDERRTDCPPRERLAGEEVVLRGFGLSFLGAGYPPADADERHGVDAEDDKI